MDLKVKPKYNGNIAEAEWRTTTEDNEPLKRYGYSYDKLNRLLAGFYQKEGSETAKEYFEIMQYDLNGNITRLQRSAGVIAGSTALKIDNLRYDYTGNRLTKVTEEQIGNSNGYPYLSSHNIIEYDNNTANGNGNMTRHWDKNIASIVYNYLNLPINIITGSSKKQSQTRYLYRADGTKLAKFTTNPFFIGNRQVDYLDGFQYDTLVDLCIGCPMQVADLKFVPTSEGYFDFEKNLYIYNYTDHLGNVRLSYADSDQDGAIQPRDMNVKHCQDMGDGNVACYDVWMPGEVVEVNNYYPFGMMHNYTGTTLNSYQYKYQGQELQETGFYSFKWRNYMPDVGRFFNVDPLTEEYPTWSPYVFSGNRVIDAREIEGLEPHVLFGTQDKAARNFGKQYNGKSILNKREYSAFIYSIDVDNKTYYAYNTPAKGNQHGIPKNKLNKYTPKGGKIVAYIHTHGNDDPEYDDENFSGEVGKQGGDIGYAEEQKLGAYLVTPGGVLEYFDVNTGEAYTLNYDMPSDPKSKNRQNTIDPEMSPLPSEGDGPRPTPKRYPNPTEPKFDNILKSIKDKKRMEIILIDQPQKYHR